MSRHRFCCAIQGLIITSTLLLTACGGDEGAAPQLSQDSPTAPEAATPPPDPVANLLAPDPDKVVATVNGAPILASAVFDVAKANKLRALAQGVQMTEDFDRQLLAGSLQVLVQAELMIQEARKQGLSVDPDRADEEFEAISSMPDFDAYLEAHGFDESDVRKEIERRLLMDAYRAQVGADEPVPEAEARKMYDANTQVFQEPERVRAAQILVRTNPNAPPELREKAQSRIQEAHGRLVAGEDFAAVAREYSEAPNADKGGELGYFTHGEMLRKFDEMAFSLPVGEISPVFETAYGFNVIKVLDKRDARVRSFDEVKPVIVAELARQRQSEALNAELAKLQATAEVEILDETFLNASEAEQPAAEGPTGQG